MPDMVAVFDDVDTYKVRDYGDKMRHHAVRVGIYEDRFIQLEERFFCDKPTEKSVEITVRIQK